MRNPDGRQSSPSHGHLLGASSPSGVSCLLASRTRLAVSWSVFFNFERISAATLLATMCLILLRSTWQSVCSGIPIGSYVAHKLRSIQY
ncbi:hypothetical protein BDW74DRAFT_148937 [Aspergillus multicolor]|uniref:uncharacterized protein n=1 Tax=Aspergillus multicolor TaxID=41759 RepID=UPI003CCDA6D4